MGRKSRETGGETDPERLREWATRRADAATVALERGEFNVALVEFEDALAAFRDARSRTAGDVVLERDLDEQIATHSETHALLAEACRSKMGIYTRAGRQHLERADERRAEGAPLAAGEELIRAKRWFLDARNVVESQRLRDALSRLIVQIDHDRATIGVSATQRRLRHGIENATTLVDAADHHFHRENYREARSTFREAKTSLTRLQSKIDRAADSSVVTEDVPCVVCQATGSHALSLTGFEDVVLCVGCLDDHKATLDVFEATVLPALDHVTTMIGRLSTNECDRSTDAQPNSRPVGSRIQTTAWTVTDSKLLSALSALTTELGRVPTATDVATLGTFSLYQYHRSFGPLENALMGAGLVDETSAE